ncbi:13226_t:CDS:2, partial [Acaulospora colombiana]
AQVTACGLGAAAQAKANLLTPAQQAQGGNAVWSPNTGKTSLGSVWHNVAPPLHQAGTLIHELSHQVARTGDHVLMTDDSIINSSQAKQAAAGTVDVGGGYIKGGMTAEKIKAAGPNGLPTAWTDLMDKTPNPYNNADSWK